MSIHLVIIDAMNLIRRVHGAQPDPDDIKNTSKVCCQALSKIIHFSAPTHIVAVFDSMEKDRGWRAELLPEYKQGRKPMPAALQEGLDSIQDAFSDLGVDSLLSSSDEADDMIATLATKVAQNVAMKEGKVTIVSTDTGYCQLLQPALSVRDYFLQRWLDIPFVEKKFAVLPNQLTDYWGLAGMSSSGVSGVPNIGQKTAAILLQNHASLAQIFASKDIPEKLAKKLDGNEELAQRCKQVATLKTDIILGFNLQDIRFNPVAKMGYPT